jgi:hypothetical protein
MSRAVGCGNFMGAGMLYDPFRILVPFAAGFYERCRKMGFFFPERRKDARLMNAFGNIPLTSADRSGI